MVESKIQMIAREKLIESTKGKLQRVPELQEVTVLTSTKVNLATPKIG